MRGIVDPFLVEFIFNRGALSRIEAAIKDAESGTSGEIRFVVEGFLPLASILKGEGARERGEALFSKYRIWDTEENTGVLIYLLLSRRRFEIVADRGITRKVPKERWQNIAGSMQSKFMNRNYVEGVVAAIKEIGEELRGNFRSLSDIEGNELPDRIERL